MQKGRQKTINDYTKLGDHPFFFFFIGKEKSYKMERGDTKNNALRVYRKYAKEA